MVVAKLYAKNAEPQRRREIVGCSLKVIKRDSMTLKGDCFRLWEKRRLGEVSYGGLPEQYRSLCD